MQRKLTNPADLRYNIMPRLDRIGRQKALIIRRIVIAKTGKDQSTYHRYLHIKKDDTQDIPAMVLYHFSIQLGVPMDQLLNFKLTENESHPAKI